MIEFQGLKVIALAIGIAALSACASTDTNQGMVPAAKMDNGLGDLPHYRDWVDPSGHAPMQRVHAAARS